MPAPPPIVLASSSPYRRELLGRLQLPFEHFRPDIDESALPGEDAPTLVARLAEAKARAGTGRFPRHLLIGSDQVASLDGAILSKPGNHATACRQLTAASGRRVTFYTGLCLYDSSRGTAQNEVVPFHVHFRQLDEAAIDRYLRREQPYDCAGSFKMEGLGIALFTRLEGEDPNALVGLPLIALVTMLQSAGWRVI